MAQAYIQSIDVKEVQGQYGPMKMHDMVLSNGDKIGLGKFPPKGFQAGDYVNYEVTMRGQYKNLTPGSLSKATPPAGVNPPAAAPARTGGYVSNDKRQETISKQAALNSAMTFVGLLATADALPITKSTKADQKADIVEGIVLRYTAKFYNMATGETYDMPEAGVDDADLTGAEEATDWNE